MKGALIYFFESYRDENKQSNYKNNAVAKKKRKICDEDDEVT